MTDKSLFEEIDKKKELDIKAQKWALRIAFLLGIAFVIGCPFFFIWTFFGGIAAGIIGCVLLYTAKELSKGLIEQKS